MMRYGGFGGAHGHMAVGGWYGGPLMLLLGLFVFIGIAILVVWAIRTVAGHQRLWPLNDPFAARDNDDLIDLAKRRLANGEVTVEQFEVIKDALTT